MLFVLFMIFFIVLHITKYAWHFLMVLVFVYNPFCACSSTLTKNKQTTWKKDYCRSPICLPQLIQSSNIILVSHLYSNPSSISFVDPHLISLFGPIFKYLKPKCKQWWSVPKIVANYIQYYSFLLCFYMKLWIIFVIVVSNFCRRNTRACT